MVQNISYKYRIYPNQDQKIQLGQITGSVRWLWNHMLDLNKTKYQKTKKFVFAIEMANMIPKLKQEHTWLVESIPSQSLQQVCRDLEQALKNCYKSGFGFPKFKAKNRSKDSFRIPQTNGHIHISNSHIKIPKIGLVRWKYHRPITGIIKSITVSKDRINHWYVSVLLEVPETMPVQIDRTKTIGIDLGVASFATLSNGTKIESQNFLRNQLRKLKRAQRKLRLKKQTSNRRKKQNRVIAKIHRTIARKRINWLHHQSINLIRKYDLICVEDLSTKDLLKKKILSRSIADQSWAIFVNQLQYKAKLYGKHLTKIDRYAPSSQACSGCGTKQKLKLSDRIYICNNPECTDYLRTKDRDENAAKNIHFWGIASTDYDLFLKSNTDGTSGINACGDTSADDNFEYSRSYRVSTNQEACGSLVHR